VLDDVLGVGRPMGAPPPWPMSAPDAAAIRQLRAFLQTYQDGTDDWPHAAT
jgi:hypothetical protein